LLAAGKTDEAASAFSKALDVTPEMAFRVIKELRKREGVRVTVAPYEADAQLAYLSIHAHVDFVISEDSDLLPYGCARVLYKLDKSGFGQMIEARRLPLVDDIALVHFTPDQFLDMCILTGCDYLPSLPGMGVKRAHGFVQRYRTTAVLMRALRVELGDAVPDDYERRFYRARMTFKHQTVFCIEAQRNVPLAPIVNVPEILFGCDLDFLGPAVPRDLAAGVARGHLHPVSLEPFEPSAPADRTPVQATRDDSPNLFGTTTSENVAPPPPPATRQPPLYIYAVAANTSAVASTAEPTRSSNPFMAAPSSTVSSRPPPTRPPSFASFASRFVSPALATLPLNRGNRAAPAAKRVAREGEM